MDISIFLAKVLGLYLLIMAIAMLVNGQRFRNMVNEVSGNALIFFSGIMALIIGILIVVSHNIWVTDWRVIITIIGWLALIKGIVRLLFPEFVMKKVRVFVENNTAYYIITIILLIVGIYLVYAGFTS